MEPPVFGYVRVQLIQDGTIAVIEFKRPESGNSLFPQLLSDTLTAHIWANEQPQISVIVQTGTGRFFNTGLDLNHLKGMSFAIGSDFHKLNRTLIASEKILIGMVNGPAVGYGVSMLALLDLVYCVPEAYFFTPFVKWGMAAEGASSLTFPSLMGHQRAAALFLTGERISAVEAQSLGLVNKIVAKRELLTHVIVVAKQLSAMPQESLRATKRLMKEPVKQQLLDANDRECDDIHQHRFLREEFLEAIKQFKAKKRQKRSTESKL
ncbi:unnamed protein product [Clonostachys rosea]|uniref:Enoyl-CoA hydratase n=1 Tax=Bionectria ochroleuca TaxID=29856 RepID=A0ABY6V210_BIOOC|nr:unnamed protein product [Clonostachys rosea]